MKKINLGKKTAIMNSNMSRRKLYIDTDHADSIKKNIVKQLDVLNKSFDQMSSLLNKMTYKKMLLEDSHSIAIQCSKKCLSHAQLADQLKESIEAKYNDDVKTSLIMKLDERISYLERKLLSK